MSLFMIMIKKLLKNNNNYAYNLLLFRIKIYIIF